MVLLVREKDSHRSSFVSPGQVGCFVGASLVMHPRSREQLFLLWKSLVGVPVYGDRVYQKKYEEPYEEMDGVHRGAKAMVAVARRLRGGWRS